MHHPESQTPPDGGESLPTAIRRALGPLANATDTEAPENDNKVPVVPLSHRISVIASTVGSILRASPIFCFGSSISTVDEEGTIESMNAERFTSWVEYYLVFQRGETVESIGKDMAGKILASDQFKRHLRVLKGVAEVRLPVWRENEDGRTIELAPEGYDQGTGIFTLNRIPYSEDMSLDESWEVLFNYHSEFSFHPEDQEKVSKRRSFSGQLAAMFGFYCYSLFPEGTPRPMIIYNANVPGSGKSLLMRMALAPAFGAPGESGKGSTEAEFEKALDTAAIARKPFLALDDCSSIHSNALNRFVTSPVHECRLMHSQRQATIPKVTQVIATGNNLSVSADLERRSLIIDLMEQEDVSSRKFKKEITSQWVFDPKNRAMFLAAMWAWVKSWRNQGMPIMKENRRPSFEDWTGLIGGILECHKLTNPFSARLSGMGGDEQGRAMERLLAIAAGELPDGSSCSFTPAELLEISNREELTDLLNFRDKESPEKALGKRLRGSPGRIGYVNRRFVDTKGRRFEFGPGRDSKGARYSVKFL